METKFFYLALTPTISTLSFIYSKSFSITYDNDTYLSFEQSNYENQFRASNGNPANYNAQWSTDYDDLPTANANRTSEINALKNAGKIVSEPNWP